MSRVRAASPPAVAIRPRWGWRRHVRGRRVDHGAGDRRRGRNRDSIATIATYIVRRQNANGSWDYTHRTAGDTSISQYAVLGLWEAENVGVDVPPSIWDRAASWYMSVQSSAGSWNYHRDEASQPETCAMTAAGIGSLLICQRQLERYRHRAEPRDQLALDGPGHRSQPSMRISTRRRPSPRSTRPSTAASRGSRRISRRMCRPTPARRRITCSTASSESAPWPTARRSAASTGTRRGATSSGRPSRPTARGTASTGSR